MVGDAIHSVLDQTYADWELIIVDDGSTDNTGDIIERMTDPRIHYVYQENRGLPGARNTGIRRAQGQYIAFLDSDDLFLSHKLSAQVAILEENPDVGLVASGYFEVDDQLRILRELQPWQKHPTLEFRDWLFVCPFCPSVVMVRKAWLVRADLFDERIKGPDDWDMWLRLAQQGCRMTWFKGPVCQYRLHGSNMVRDALFMKTGMLIMLDKLYAQPDLPGEIVALRDQVYANVYLNAAARAYAGGAVDEGKAWLTQAIDLNPALLAGDPPKVLDNLASFALSPLAGDSAAFMDRLMSNLPEREGLPRWSRRKARGLLHAVAAFEHHQGQDRAAAARNALSALVCDPGWVRNRGALSIIRRSLWG
jgi:glycosyltransferase involved in cell wall biosynthesis